MGTHLFSTTKAAKNGSSCVMRSDTAYIENGGRVIPLQTNANKMRYYLDLQINSRISEEQAEWVRASMP